MAISLPGTPVVLFGSYTPAGTDEVSVPIYKNEQGPFAEAEIETGVDLVIGRVVVTAESATEFRLEKSPDGSVWTPVLEVLLAGPGSLELSPSIIIYGKSYIRVRARNLTSAAKVSVSAYGSEVHLS